MVGNFGNAEVFSFHATKFFNTLEGGAVVTNDDDLAKKMRLMKNFGFAGYDNVVYIGTNGKMNEASAAMGLANLQSLGDYVAINSENYECYVSGLKDIPGIKILRYENNEKQNFQYIVTEVDECEAGLSRDDLLKVLHAENVLARRYFYPGCHRMEPYRSFFPHSHLLLPETEKVAQRVMILPTGTSVTKDQISLICSIIRTAIQYSSIIKEK